MLVRNRQRVGALVVMALVIGAQFSTFFLVTQYLQLVLGFSPVATGVAFLPLSLSIFAMSRVSARLVARVGPRLLMIVGTAGLVTSFVWLSTLTETSTYAVHLLGPLVLNGASAALVFMPVTVIVLGGVDRAHAGSVSGLLQTTQQLGGAVGLAVIVSVYALRGGPGPVRAGHARGVPRLGRGDRHRVRGRQPRAAPAAARAKAGPRGSSGGSVCAGCRPGSTGRRLIRRLIGPADAAGRAPTRERAQRHTCWCRGQ